MLFRIADPFIVNDPLQVKVNLGGRSYIDEEGNVISGRQLDMVVEGNDVFIVSETCSQMII